VRDERGPARRPARGFSLLELLIVIVIVAVLFAVAVDRMLRLRLEAERVMVEGMLTNLRSALYIEFAGAAVRGRPGAAAAAATGSNPMRLLAERPGTYAGEYAAADPEAVAAGSWYFDTAARQLVYIVRFPEQFETSLAGRPRARWRVEPDFDDLDGDGRFDAARDAPRGLRLVPVEPYRWREPE
jgi:prepilin-type N-terminal cleavage/methylation domain-containing protein